MSLVRQLLTDKKGAILERWRREVMDSYPAETGSFLASEQDLFLNPVGDAIRRTGEILFEVAVQGMEKERLEDGLQQLVRIRAVQDMAASRALSFFSIMKRIIREEVMVEVGRREEFQELGVMDERLDAAMLAALDLYCTCRGQVDELRVKEVKTEKERLLKLIAAMNRGAGRTVK